jgi:hypothetical protein
MAELNFGLLNPPGSQSIGNAFVSGMDQAAAARAQENQNALAQYTLSKAKREDQLTNQMLAGMQGATTIEQQADVLRRGGKYKEANELLTSGLDREIKQGTLAGLPGAQAKTAAETQKLNDDARIKGMTEVAGFPDAESANAAIDARLGNKTIDQATADQLRQGLTPENFIPWQRNTLVRMLSPEAQLKQGVLTYKDTDLGSTIERQAFNAQGKPVGPPEVRAKTVAPTVTTVEDPTKPGTFLQVDARVYTGGGKGSAGVIGNARPPTPAAIQNVNTFTPASEEAQKDFMKSTRATYDTLKQSSAMFANIEAAKKLIPSASVFMGTGGEGMKAAASFLNNRLGMSINTEGVKNAEELRSRLFQGVMANLKKLDSQPSERQQAALENALGSLNTDPNALSNVMEAYADSIRNNIATHNAEVQSAISRGVKFPYDPIIKIPPKIADGVTTNPQFPGFSIRKP